ncbi:YcxB family protein [Asticcacaulis endophyticus]|uniref:YcxB family protein n=1 Tax=Asticcacaulis endophyticus TaxID=1395890 RepID=UPI00167B412D|nr:YcxB family protein [Asticcacaulis endophyticus]
MTEAALKTNSYKIKSENLTDFFTVWLKKHYFDKNLWRKLWISSAIIIAIMMFVTVPILTTMTSDLNDYPWLGPIVIFFTILITCLACLLMTAAFLFVASPLINYLTQLLIFVISPVSRRENQVEITSSKLFKSSGNKDSETDWAKIYDVSETRKTILLFYNKNSAIIIPKSAFDSSDDADVFAKASSKHWLLAKDTTF